MIYLFLLVLFSVSSLNASPVLAGERSRNLKTLEASPLLFEFHKFTTTDYRQRFYFPQRDSAWRRNYNEEEKDALL